MWRKLILGLVIVPLGVLLVALAVVNRTPAQLVLDPFGGAESSLTFSAPLFLFLLGAFALGLIVGGLATWLKQGKWRKTARTRRREADEWHARADQLEKELGAAEPAPGRLQLPAD